MSRPNILMAEPEPEEALSARKLVLETAKFNVLTAYSGKEAIELLRMFPKVTCLVAHYDLPDIPCEQVVQEAKRINPEICIIALCGSVGYRCEGADEQVNSHSPEDLIHLLREKFGDPRNLNKPKHDAA